MNKKFLLSLTKREKFVIAVFILSIGLFIFEYFGIKGIVFGIFLSLITDSILYFILRKDIKGTFFYPILILPFFYTLSFSFFYLLFPSRFISRILITATYSFGLYSLFLTQNIFAISSIRTINLVRSARIIAFVITIVIFFFLTNVLFSSHIAIFFIPLIVFLIVFILNFQSFWFYSLDKKDLKEIMIYALLNSFCLSELSLVLTVWPVPPTIYSISLTGIFYFFSGLSQQWFEQRLFRGILWEYVWVGFLSILLLILFSSWGI